jgi:hypothetical protein
MMKAHINLEYQVAKYNDLHAWSVLSGWYFTMHVHLWHARGMCASAVRKLCRQAIRCRSPFEPWTLDQSVYGWQSTTREFFSTWLCRFLNMPRGEGREGNATIPGLGDASRYGSGAVSSREVPSLGSSRPYQPPDGVSRPSRQRGRIKVSQPHIVMACV